MGYWGNFIEQMAVECSGGRIRRGGRREARRTRRRNPNSEIRIGFLRVLRASLRPPRLNERALHSTAKRSQSRPLLLPLLERRRVGGTRRGGRDDVGLRPAVRPRAEGVAEPAQRLRRGRAD